MKETFPTTTQPNEEVDAPKPKHALEVKDDDYQPKHELFATPQHDAQEAPEHALVESIDNQPDAETRYKDAEILGNSYPVKAMIESTGNNAASKAQEFTAHFLNITEPGGVKFALAKFVAEKSYNYHKKRADAVDNLPDDHRLKKHRQAKLAKATALRDDKVSRFKERKQTMANRLETVKDNKELRKNEYTAKLKNRRELAVGRKTARKELRNQGASILEARELVANIPQEHLQRVGNIAITAKLSEQDKQSKINELSGIVKTASRLENKVSKALEGYKKHIIGAENATATIKTIETTNLPEAEQTLKQLQEQLQQMRGDTEAEPKRAISPEDTEDGSDDEPKVNEPEFAEPKREQIGDSDEMTNLKLQIQQAEDKVAIYKRDITYWQSQVDYHTKQAEENKRAGITARHNISALSIAHEGAMKEYNQLQSVANTDQESLEQAKKDVLGEDN